MTRSSLYPPGPSNLFDDAEAQRRYAEDEDEATDLFLQDPGLTLRRATTAHSVIAESIKAEDAQNKRNRKRSRLFSGIKRVPTLVSNAGSRRKRATTISEVGSIDTRGRSSTIASSADGKDMLLKEAQIPPPTQPSTSAEKLKKPSLLATLLSGKRPTPLTRRTVYVNIPLPHDQLKRSGEPLIKYARNKVRTAKYTLITFLPKNLFEQFRRWANVYFLILVILGLFSVFGAPNGQIGMLPLLAILSIAAIKDGIEDWRRSRLDDEVNNSATTKLEGWRNVNQPQDPRSLLERIFGIGSGEVSFLQC